MIIGSVRYKSGEKVHRADVFCKPFDYRGAIQRDDIFSYSLAIRYVGGGHYLEIDEKYKSGEEMDAEIVGMVQTILLNDGTLFECAYGDWEIKQYHGKSYIDVV